MASTEDPAPQTPSGTTRRTVLKAAGHTAWMIPAVQIASQVPALAAASTNGLVLTDSSHSHYGSNPATYQSYFGVKNTSGNSGKDSTATLVVTIHGTPASFSISNLAIGSGLTRTDSGGATPSTTNGSITLTFTTTTLAKNNGGVYPSIVFNTTATISTMSFNATSPAGLSSDSMSITF